MGIIGNISKWSTVKKMNVWGLLVLIATAIPIWFGIGMPFPITFTTQGFYDSLRNLSPGSVVVVGWQATKFEQYKGLETTAAAVWKYMHSRGLKVINLALGFMAPQFFEDIYYTRFKVAELYGLKYGEDYVITPYVAGEETAMAAFAKDTWSVTATDYFGEPIKGLPLMQRVLTFADVDLAIMSSYSYSNYDQYVRQWGQAYQKPLLLAFHGFTPVAWAYPWPVTGALDGDRGNAEFEYLTGFRGDALARFEAMSTSGLTLLILFVVLLLGARGLPKIRVREVAKA